MSIALEADVRPMIPFAPERGKAVAHPMLRDAAPDLSMQVEAYLPDRDRVADGSRLRDMPSGLPRFGRAPAGRPFEIGGMDGVRMDDEGRITGIWQW
jgi:hypothetical protein